MADSETKQLNKWRSRKTFLSHFKADEWDFICVFPLQIEN